MLDAYIIEEIRRKEEEKRQREMPRLRIEIPRDPRPERPKDQSEPTQTQVPYFEDEEDGQDEADGVIQIRL